MKKLFKSNGFFNVVQVNLYKKAYHTSIILTLISNEGLSFLSDVLHSPF
jgi:hypothetical protein